MRCVPLVLAFAAATTGRAHADEPIVDRDYAIDFYDGVAIGNTAWVGMGGAGAALIVGSAGALINPSAPAVRPTTDTDTWSWDYHFDYLTGQYSSDYDNNGVALPEGGGAQLITAGLSGRRRNWAAAVTVTGQTAPIDDGALAADALRLRYMVAKYFPERDIAVGLGMQQVIFQLGNDAEVPLFSINGVGLVGGITYVPRLRNFRIAGGIESRILGGDVTYGNCDPLNCNGYILPRSVVSPARAIAGFAYRFAETAWNQQVGGIFRDEQSLTLTADVLVTGDSPDAYGIEAFGMQRLQRSGESYAVSARAGVEVEPLPGRLRVRAGSYWEPARFEGVSGRIHGTFGLELRALEFEVWGRRRGRLSFTGDVASRYRNIAVSIGFWH
ncbi:MAG: hypothetical protein SFX73_16565 [Kofleriaceae bacterium]|nr:hypothetical protein [Kofleriaceae bacterium]